MGPEYKHQPTAPAVLKVEKTEHDTIITCSAGKIMIRDNPALDGTAYLVPTKRQIVKFIQELWNEHTEPHESGCPSEETILAAYDKSFKIN